MTMEAIYNIQTGQQMISFKAKALPLNKCLQIKRISEAEKHWKGYRLIAMSYSPYGLCDIHIANTRGVIYNDLWNKIKSL